MPLLKGPKVKGYIEIDENVRFMRNLVTRYAAPWSQIFFVDGVNGSDTKNTGRTPDRAFATIGKAITAATRGDVIYVRPLNYMVGDSLDRFDRYTENIIVPLGGPGGSGGVAATKSDISLIGVTPSMNPELGPRIKGTTIALQIDAPAFHLENIAIFAEDATYAIYLRNDGISYTKRGSDGFTMYNCVVKGSGLYAASGGDGTVIKKCRFHTKYDGTSGGIGAILYSCSANPGNRLQILENFFHGGNVTEQPATAYITILPPLAVGLIKGNVFFKIPADGHYINAAGAANTGAIVDNFFAYSNVIPETDLHIGGMVQAGNWDTAGILV
jgi:hypothetical protein